MQTTSWKKCSVFGTFRFSEFRINDCERVNIYIYIYIRSRVKCGNEVNGQLVYREALGRFWSSLAPNTSFGVQTTSWKKISVFGTFRFSEFRINDCERVNIYIYIRSRVKCGNEVNGQLVYREALLFHENEKFRGKRV